MIIPRHTYRVLPPRTGRTTGLDWDSEIRIALPPSYDSSDRAYPTLWITDGSLFFDVVLGIANIMTLTQELPELVLVGVGAPPELDPFEFSRRRIYEFYSAARWVNAGPGGTAMEAKQPPELRLAGGGADALLTFLVDELRPSLGEEFRLDRADHALLGGSAGGYFVVHSLFSRPQAFHKYLAGSPPLSGCEDALFDLEAAYAQSHADMDAHLFLSAGELEVLDPYIAAADVAGSMTRMAQLLRLRSYPSLNLQVRLFGGQTHASGAAAAFADGLRALYPVAPASVEQLMESMGVGREAAVSD